MSVFDNGLSKESEQTSPNSEGVGSGFGFSPIDGDNMVFEWEYAEGLTGKWLSMVEVVVVLANAAAEAETLAAAVAVMLVLVGPLETEWPV